VGFFLNFPGNFFPVEPKFAHHQQTRNALLHFEVPKSAQKHCQNFKASWSWFADDYLLTICYPQVIPAPRDMMVLCFTGGCFLWNFHATDSHHTSHIIHQSHSGHWEIFKVGNHREYVLFGVKYSHVRPTRKLVDHLWWS
jgi:hypothetical protein